MTMEARETKIGILPLARATFDVAYAEDTLASMLAALDATGHEIAGPRGLLFDTDATRMAMDALEADGEIGRAHV